MFLIAFTGVLASDRLMADTVYIRDAIYVPLRGGQSTEYRILHRGIKSGTPLERLATNDETGYTQVRTEGGLEGWLQTQYIVEEPIAADRLAPVQAKLETIEAEHQQTLLRLREAREEITRLTQQYEELNAVAGNVVSINEDNDRLLTDMDALSAQMAMVLEENDVLQSSSSRQWFLAGGGTVLIGLLFGFWVGRRIYQKRGTGGWA